MDNYGKTGILVTRFLLLLFFLVVLPGLFSTAVLAEESSGVGTNKLYPSPEPFSVNYYDARMAAAMLDREGFVRIYPEGEKMRTVRVREIKIVYEGKDPDLPRPHRDRFTLYLNGKKLDWGRTYLEYGNEMVNLQLLFTYRNQRPFPEEPYRFGS